MGKKPHVCVHCGKVNEVEAVDDRDLADLLGKITAGMPKVDVKALAAEVRAAIPDMTPEDACKKYGLCSVATLDAAKKELDELKGAHPAITEEFLASQEKDCPTCGPHIKAFKQKAIDAAIKEGGYVKPVTDPAVPAGAEKSPWER